MIPLFDTHQHFIYPNVAGYAWAERNAALGGRSFTIEDYHELTVGRGIIGSLFMETDANEADMAKEARHVAGLAAIPGNGIRGLVPSCRPERDDGFAEWLDDARSLGAVGMRRILHEVDDTVSTTETFRSNVRRIGEAGLTFDMVFLARQLPLAAELADACEATTLILDHCGVPDIAGGALDPWRTHMREVARRPNVSCKLSGVLAYCSAGQATREAIEPYVDHVLETFGPSRMVWGSDWPVVDMAKGLPDWLDVTQSILATLSENEANAIGHLNAARVYRIELS